MRRKRREKGVGGHRVNSAAGGTRLFCKGRKKNRKTKRFGKGGSLCRLRARRPSTIEFRGGFMGGGGGRPAEKRIFPNKAFLGKKTGP